METLKFISVVSAFGLGGQQFLQVIADPIVSSLVSWYRGSVNKKISSGQSKPFWNISDNDLKRTLLGLVSITTGLFITCFVDEVRVLSAAGIQNHPTIDWIITVLTLSAGTEGANSIIKFAQYSKDAMKPNKTGGAPAPPPNIGPHPG
jgi:hypothetical protein